MKRAAILAIGIALIRPLGWALESAEESGAGKVGPNLAVSAASPSQGFKLSEQAAATIGLALSPVNTEGSLVVPKDAIVRSNDETGIYRSRQGWLKFIPGRAESEDGRWRFVPANDRDLRPGDHVITGGVPLVRVTDTYIHSAAEGEGE